ncbi:sigma-70 family RNA polymerase sigma factor [Microbacterium sp. B2969]|uniref:Sigma-70 family RNA polymerase sigma factor n=1 Tax=Microbacterium alkaliflavum TaxID=3248839 RepID=A0ABW7Q6X1_9MICO
MTSIDSHGDAAVRLGDSADADLVLRTRSGDSSAFGELWFRHYRSGITVARAVTSTHDADDLVQEAYARIYQSILRGGGPTGSFRAYLFTSIRNTAAAWGRAGRETPIDILDTVEDPTTTEAATEAALDHSLTHRAFRSLPSRWQEVLWYTEIEQMKPAEVAPLLGMKPTAVAQLAFRAREGLREAWIQAHLQSVADGSDCQWTIERLGAHARENLSRRDQRKVDAHLEECTRCTIVAAEAKEVSSRLALVLLPLTLGITGSAAYLATLQTGGAPTVALAAGQGAVVPSSVPALSTVGSAPTVTGGATVGGSAAVGTTAAGGATVAGGAAVGGTSVVGTSAAFVGVAGSATLGAAAVGTAAVGTAAAAGAGGLLSSVGAIIGVTTAAAVLVGSAIAASIAGPALMASAFPVVTAAAGVLADDPAATAGDDPLAAADDETASAADGDSPATAEDATTAAGDGDSNSGDSTTTSGAASRGSSARDDEDVAGAAGGRTAPGLPAGVPAFGAASVSYAGTQPVFTIVATGEPGATVELLLNGSVASSGQVDAGGTVALSFEPTFGQVNSNARVQLRYRAGEATGTPVVMRLSDFADLAPILATMSGQPGQGGGASQGNGATDGSNASDGSTGNTGGANGHGKGGSGNGAAQGNANGAGTGTTTGDGTAATDGGSQNGKSGEKGNGGNGSAGTPSGNGTPGTPNGNGPATNNGGTGNGGTNGNGGTTGNGGTPAGGAGTNNGGTNNGGTNNGNGNGPTGNNGKGKGANAEAPSALILTGLPVALRATAAGAEMPAA